MDTYLSNYGIISTYNESVFIKRTGPFTFAFFTMHDPDRRTYADDLARNWLDEASQPSQRHNRPPSRRVSPVRRPTDRLRLATAVNKLEPVYISQSADCRQATDDFLKNRFHTSGQGREFNIFVVIEREVNNNGPHDRSSQKGVIKKEKNERRDMPLNLLDDSWYSLFLFIYYMHFNDTYATKRVTKPVGEGFDESNYRLIPRAANEVRGTVQRKAKQSSSKGMEKKARWYTFDGLRCLWNLWSAQSSDYALRNSFILDSGALLSSPQA
ncbi:hypothetical protein V8E54_014676 [Elaphomyces granulatus]